MMIKELKLTRRKKLLGAIIICVILITGSTTLWQMSQVAEAAILEPYHEGLVGWWRFDEGVGAVAEDSSGNENEGTISGATWVAGKYGGALSSDGTNDYVRVSNTPTLQITDNLTIVAWIRTTDITKAYQVVVEKAWNREFQFRLEANGLVRFYHGGTGGYEGQLLFPVGTVQQDTWTFLAVVRDTSSLTITGYKDGVAGTPKSYTKTISSSTSDVEIGSQDGNGHFFQGEIDEVRIYDRALSAAEIQESFQKRPDFSSRFLAKVSEGTTEFIATLSWQGIGGINVTIESPSETYTEDTVPVYQKTVYSSSSGDMLNIKRLAVSVTALSNNENWYIILELDNVEDYKITVEVQR